MRIQRQPITKRNAYGAYYGTLRKTGSIEKAVKEYWRVMNLKKKGKKNE